MGKIEPTRKDYFFALFPKLEETVELVEVLLEHSFMSHLYVYALPELVEPEELRDGVVIVIDVLRATTTIVSALHAGAKCVVPLLEVEETLNLKRTLEETELLLGGERRGKRVDSFDLGNSPQEYTNERVAGKTILFSTTNGTKALYRAILAETILPTCFLNAQAVVEFVSPCDTVHILCAGTDGRITEEDLYLAGLLVKRIQQNSKSRFQLNAQAIAARETWERLFKTEQVSGRTLASHLYQSRGGRNLRKIGLKTDIDISACIDSVSLVVKFDPKTGRIS
ncbi:MAG: 2-phosphosulfolactate phosphatase [Planctomycetaceae bacterium]|nr:2-phosphosulfolactate phosphatase [Planctomycetaceae bacterium]